MPYHGGRLEVQSSCYTKIGAQQYLLRGSCWALEEVEVGSGSGDGVFVEESASMAFPILFGVKLKVGYKHFLFIILKAYVHIPVHYLGVLLCSFHAANFPKDPHTLLLKIVGGVDTTWSVFMLIDFSLLIFPFFELFHIYTPYILGFPDSHVFGFEE
ncbi:hypothetical protein ACJX0J_035831 [Zea mays]